MAKILVTGSKGFIGRKVVERLSGKHEVYKLSRREHPSFKSSNVDITNLEKLEKFVSEVKPDIVIHTAALTWVDYCENHPDEAFTTNVEGTKNLLTNAHNSKFIYISTDYVYEGKKGVLYTEDSETRPVNYYGKTKLLAEQEVMKHQNYLILRPTVIFGHHEKGKNFFMQCIAKHGTDETFGVVDDQISNPTDIDFLGAVIDVSIEKDLSGIYNATGPQTLSRYDFAQLIFGELNSPTSLLRKKTTETSQVAKRPMICATSSKKLYNELQIQPPPLIKSIRAHISNYKNGK